MEILMEHLGRGLMLSLLLSLPCVLAAAGIGLIVGILQAVTQVQEQTIAAAPKIIGVFMIILIGGGFMMNALSDYVRESFHSAFNEIPGDGLFILPAMRHQTEGQIRARKFFDLQTQNAPNSEKLKAFSSQMPKMSKDDTGGALLKTNQASGASHALQLSEKMALQKQKQGSGE
jgi:flagellar biosynthesis protein FliQ